MKKIFFLFVFLLLITGCSVKKATELTDAEKFANEYSVSEKNQFKYVNIDETIDIIKNGTGIIFFGNSDCEWCVASAQILTDVLKNEKSLKIYYYNPKMIQDKNTKKYKQLITLLKDYLETDKEDNSYLFLPDIYFVKNGRIIGHNNDLATMNGTIEKSLTEKRKKQIKNKYKKLIDETIKECTNNC